MYAYLRLCFFCAALTAIGQTAAAEPTLRVSGQLGYACYKQGVRYHGAGGGASTALFFDDAWGIRAGYNLSDFRSKGTAFRIQHGELGIVYQLDAFAYVPWVALSGTVFAPGGEPVGDAIQGGYSMGVGFDRLLDANWLIGPAIELKSMSDAPENPALVSVMIRLGYRWTTLGDPYAP
ncbi:MAG: hypothetical protein VX589_11670 [Myxococcota bacterium]|nr:hypothetical protein [Myxococcota bacterium]